MAKVRKQLRKNSPWKSFGEHNYALFIYYFLPTLVNLQVDRISILLDEILVSILSLLSYKEAVTTSILSHRWKYMWTYVSNLNFDGTKSLLNPPIHREEKRWDFVSSVDHAITLQESPVIEGFRVLYDLKKTHSKSIDKWLEFAFARKVQRLELNWLEPFTWYQEWDGSYTFPYKFYSGSIDCKCLKSIVTNIVNLNGEAIEFFLHNCPLLEELSVSASINLLSLKIVEPPPSFKRLELSSCKKLNSVEIRHANLVHLKYKGSAIHFVIENVPLLTSLSIGGRVACIVKDGISLFSSILPRLETFEIHGADALESKDTRTYHSTVEMTHLKQLVVGFTDVLYYSVLHLIVLIDASPCLERLLLVNSLPYKMRWKVDKIKRHFCLKHIEFKGYNGGKHHLHIVTMLLENAVNLETLVIDLSNPAYTLVSRRKADIKRENNARALATKTLENLVPPRIKLKIVDMEKDARVPATK